MKKITLLLLVLVLLQSCHSYKKTAIADVQVDKFYVMQLNNEMRVRGTCHDISTDSLEFQVKNRLLKYAKNDVGLVKRKKVSALKSVGVLAVVTTAAVLSVTSNKVPSTFSLTAPN